MEHKFVQLLMKISSVLKSDLYWEKQTVELNNLDSNLQGSELFSKRYLGRAEANLNELVPKKWKTEGDVQVDC